jgi:hypothetical protein
MTSRLLKKPSLWRTFSPIHKFSLYFAIKRDGKGDESHTFWEPDDKHDPVLKSVKANKIFFALLIIENSY